MRAKFNEAVSLVFAKKCVDNKLLLTEEEYNKEIEQVLQSEEILKNSGSKETNMDCHTVCKYGTLIVNGRENCLSQMFYTTLQLLISLM